MRDDYLKYDEIPSFFDDVLTESTGYDDDDEYTGYDDTDTGVTWYESYSTYMEDAENLLRNLTPAQFTTVVETAMENGYTLDSYYSEAVLDGLKKAAGNVASGAKKAASAANDTKNKVVNKLIVDPMNKRKEKKKEERKAARYKRQYEEDQFKEVRDKYDNYENAFDTIDSNLKKVFGNHPINDEVSKIARDFYNIENNGLIKKCRRVAEDMLKKYPAGNVTTNHCKAELIRVVTGISTSLEKLTDAELNKRHVTRSFFEYASKAIAEYVKVMQSSKGK